MKLNARQRRWRRNRIIGLFLLFRWLRQHEVRRLVMTASPSKRFH